MSIPGLVPASATRWLSAPRRTLARAIARRLGVPVVPVAVRYAAPALPHYARALGRRTAQDFARFVRSRLRTALDCLDLRPTPLRGA